MENIEVKKYIVIADIWKDAKSKHVYHKGDFFPYDDTTFSDARIEEIMGNKNKMGIPLIAINPDYIELDDENTSDNSDNNIPEGPNLDENTSNDSDNDDNDELKDKNKRNNQKNKKENKDE